MTIHACTIIARNYLPAARVLAVSFARHHPGSTLAVLLVDDPERTIDGATEPFGVLHLDEIGIEPDELAKMVAIYDILEISTAVKPWLVETLLARGAPAVLYLDPDVVVYAPLDELDSRARAEGIVLTPHLTRPLPRDGRSVTESDILGSGIYNLGFVAVSERAAEFLEFWKERLRRDCVADPARMRFVDQRWVDFAPGMFGAGIVRDPTYNVAYWNLHGRTLTFDGSSPRLDGEQVHFFHFSGYSPDSRHILSKHQGDRPRVVLSSRPDLARLCDDYGDRLVAAGHGRDSAVPYAFGRLANGLAYDPVMRSLYRSALLACEESGGATTSEPPNPFVRGGAQLFLDWLNAVPHERPGGHLTRYLSALHASRPDLVAVFSDPDGKDLAHFAEWSRHEVAQGRLDARLALEVPKADSTAPAPLLRLEAGIRVAGYLRAETGVGEHGRLALLAAQRAGIATSTYVDATSVSRQCHHVAASSGPDLDVNLVCVNADELPRFARRVGPGFFAGRYTIGLWAWELEEFPRRFEESFDYVDEVWANSEFTRRAIDAVSPVPVVAFPLPVVEPNVPTSVGRRDLGLPDGFLFLFCFDVMSDVERKNPFGLLDAFGRAFAPGEGPVLVVKAVNGDRRAGEVERLKREAGRRPDVIVLDHYLDRGEQSALMAACDCYVSLHRSEGFGLTLAEAMALAKPVVATAYSGNLDFMSQENSYLVPYSPGEVPVAHDPYPHGARWAEPDLDVAAASMREVYEHPETARARGARARVDVLNEHGLDARARVVAERFAHAQSVLAARRRAAARQRSSWRLWAARPR
ncbi:MAG: glycosyltransferase [Acidimicrobiales bacterium]